MAQSCKICGLQLDGFPAALPPLPVSVVDFDGPPAPHEKKTIENHILRIQEGLDAIDDAIENLRKAHADLERERAKHAGLISSLRSFPPELLSEVFLAYSDSWWENVDALEFGDGLDGWNSVESHLTRWPPDWSLVRMSPMRVVSQVCRSWRAAASACSALWSNIYLDIHDNCDINTAQRLLLDQLKLSSNHPLRIYTYVRGRAPESKLYDNYRFLLLQHIVPTHYRWKNIDIAPASDGILPLLSKSAVTPLFPWLTSLSIYFRSLPVDGISRLSAADMPLLTEASLYGYNNAHDEVFQLPWAQLRKLQLSGCDGDDAFSIIQKLQSVEELTLLGLHEPDEFAMHSLGSLTTLSSLRYLKVSGAVWDEFPHGNLLPRLCLPALRTLIWTRMRHDDVEFLSTMLRNTWPDGNPALAELYLHSPHDTMHERLDGNEATPLGRLLDLVQSQVEIIEIGYPSPSGFDLGHVMLRLSQFLEADSVPKLRRFKLQGILLDSWTVPGLLIQLKQHDIDVRLVHCAFSMYELYEGHSISGIIHRTSSDAKGYLELDIEGPNSKRLMYSLQSGFRIEEACHCKREGGTI